MPTLEQLTLALDAALNLKNLRRDIVENAKLYQARADAGHDAADIKANIAGDAAEYERRLAWHDAPDVNNDIREALTALGVTDYDDEITALADAVETQKKAKGTTVAIDLAPRKQVFKPK